MAAGYVEVLEPTAEVTPPVLAVAKPLDTLVGKTIAYHHARGPYLGVFDFAIRLGELLIGRHGVAESVRLKSVVDNGASGWSDPKLPQVIKRIYDEYAQQVDCVIVGAAFCGGSTYWSTHAAAELQDRGVPTVSLTCPAFRSLVEFTARTRGYLDLPMLILPDDFETKNEEEMHELAESRVEEVVSILTT